MNSNKFDQYTFNVTMKFQIRTLPRVYITKKFTEVTVPRILPQATKKAKQVLPTALWHQTKFNDYKMR